MLTQDPRIFDRLGYGPGVVAIGLVRAPLEGKPDGKARPVVLIHQRPDDQWLVMGLTSKATYGTGEPRVPVSDWGPAGLSGPGFLWGGRLVTLPEDDIKHVIGHVSYADALAIRPYVLDARVGGAFLAACADWERTR